MCRYIDALVLAAYFAPCGVAKADVATLPLIGTITRGMQFLFVARSGTTGDTQPPLRQPPLQPAADMSVHNGRSMLIRRLTGPARDVSGKHKRVDPLSWRTADKENQYTTRGDLRKEVASREVDIRYPRCAVGSWLLALWSDACRLFPGSSARTRWALMPSRALPRSFMIAPEGTTKPRHCLLRCALQPASVVAWPTLPHPYIRPVDVQQL